MAVEDQVRRDLSDRRAGLDAGTALAGEPHHGQVDAPIAYLTQELPRIRAPLSLAWGLIGLASWGALPREAENWLTECAHPNTPQKPGPCEDALLLLADVASTVFAPDARVAANE